MLYMYWWRLLLPGFCYIIVILNNGYQIIFVLSKTKTSDLPVT